MFAHGYHSKLQISRLIYFYFYKNVVLVACEFTFQVFAGFSRERLFIGIFVSLYNLVLSTLQSMIAIMLEHRSLRENLPMMDPSHYAAGLMSQDSGCQKKLLHDFSRWIFHAMMHGILITLIV